MSLVIYIHPPKGGGELGGFFDSLLGIVGSVAGPIAQATGLPSWASTAIGTSVPLISGLLSKPPTDNCLKGRISGNEGMQKCQDYILSGMDQLLAAVGRADSQAILDAATQLAAAPFNDAYFDQSIGGGSAKVRGTAQLLATRKLDQIKAAIAALGTPVQTDPTTGQTAIQQTPSPTTAVATGASGETLIFGYPLTTVLTVAAVGLALYAATK